jgi:hypothetical protein
MTAPTEYTWDENIAEVRRVWGDQLAPIRPELVHPLVSMRTREFLTTVGLPTIQVLDIVPIHDERLLDLVSRGHSRYVTLATNENPGTYRYGVDVATGVVMYLQDEMPQFDCLANSNIAAFVLMLGLYKHHFIDLKRATKQTVENAIDMLFDQLGGWDPVALNDEDSRWNILLDEQATQYGE